MITTELIKKLPKSDLHLHLDGSLRVETLIDLARTRGVVLPSDTPEGLNELVFKPHYANLGEYLHGFAYTCSVLQDVEALERTAYELAWDNIDEGVRYIEVRLAPQLHVNENTTTEQVLQAVNAGLERAKREHRLSEAVAVRGEPPFEYGIIVCAMRMFTSGFGWYFKHLERVTSELDEKRRFSIASLQLAQTAVKCRDELGLPIVAFDLAGQEAGYPAEDHAEAYRYAHEHFLKKTVHAGEAYGPESIFQAITALHADRIGHGYHLFRPDLITSKHVYDPEGYVRALAQFIADRRITIEVCITSNLQTNPEIKTVENHALRQMIDARLSCTLCTDNRLVSHTSMTQEIELALQGLELGTQSLRDLIIYGFKRSFYPGDYREKRAYVRKIVNYYDELMREVQPSFEPPPGR